MMRRDLVLSVCALVCVAGMACAQVTVTQSTWSTPGGTARGWIATVDLSDPRLQIKVTAPLSPPQSYEANLVATNTWHTNNGNKLSINANYFGTLPGGTTADILGLSINDGVTVSPFRQYGVNPDPALVIGADMRARVGYFNATDAAGARYAIAGIGPSGSDAVPGTMLVTDGLNTGTTARVDPTNRNPRTAIGTNQNGDRLYIVEVDGRQGGWSVGMTLPEVADILIQMGAWRGINLDGGGSSSFIYLQDNGTTVQNRPSDGSHRPVANHLGFGVNGSGSTYKTLRPIRGAWLRPPGALTGGASLETHLAYMANAGLTDLYLETFYWGLTTGGPGVFNPRFAFNYLDQAIPLAAKYNIRLHAWCESAYWAFGSNGLYNFSGANSVLQVINIATGQTGGDGTAGQVFANLCHPVAQQKMRAYFAELAGYTGLWGIQTDYHRFPLDNNTGDSYPAPWSYDTWTRATFQSIYGSDPQVTAATTSGSQWTNFLNWRKAGLSEAANQMHQGINGVNPSIDFSAAMFAVPETAKCQDWQTWARQGYIETLIPMAYGSTNTSITNDLNTVKNQANGKRVVAGLYIDSTTNHPTIANQLTAANNAAIQDWVFFSAGTFSNTTNQSTVKNYITGTTTKQRGDFNNDGYVDARDWNLFTTVRNPDVGGSIPVTAGNTRYNYNNDGFVDAQDWTLFKAEFARFRFGEDGIVDQRDLDALRRCFGATSPLYPNVHHMYDLTGDGAVTYQDELRFNSLLIVPLPFEYDLDGNGRIDNEDLYLQYANGRDVNRDGAIDLLDKQVLESKVRENENFDMYNGRR